MNMHVVYARQNPPETVTKSVFLVGPTPRAGSGGESWRPAMLAALEAAGYDGVVYVPENEGDTPWAENYLDQIEWERRYLERCDLILAWVPRDLKTMPAFTTNVEMGSFMDSGRLVYGRPEGAPKTRYLDALYKEAYDTAPLSSIEELAKVATIYLRKGAPRKGGERSVPYDIWRTQQFQSWYQALTASGNRLEDAKPLWSFRVGPRKSFLFCYTLWVKVWIEEEKRFKTNEFIFSRTDISTIVPFYRSPKGIEVVLVKEFRSPVRNARGFVYELPGGSSFKEDQDPKTVASEELSEETGLHIPPERFVPVGNRQLAATLSTHHAHAFSVELDADEIWKAKEMQKAKVTHGVEEDSEQTYVEVWSLDDIMQKGLVDWTTIGMIWGALSNRPEVSP